MLRVIDRKQGYQTKEQSRRFWDARIHPITLTRNPPMNLFKISGCVITASLLSAWLVGCSCHTHHGGHSHQVDWGKEIPPGSLPDPPGVHLQRFQATQRNNAITMEYAI